MFSIQISTPVGPLVLTGTEKGLITADFATLAGEEKRSPLLDEAACQIEHWFAGGRNSFDLPLEIRGTQFQQAVWQELQAIPWGQTRTYGDIAIALGKPGAARAVGSACGANPLILLIPCHRVLARNGKLGGFSSGLPLKRELLKREGIPWKE
jgi:methylated-DNA-[protein]-cysteine S-methyltransferase